MRIATRRHWENYRSALRFAAIVGVSFGTLAGAVVLKPPLLGAGLGAFSGLVDSLTLMLFIGGVEIFLPRTRPGRWLAQRAFLAALALKSVLYTAASAVSAASCSVAITGRAARSASSCSSTSSARLRSPRSWVPCRCIAT